MLNEPLHTDDELLEAAKKRLADAQTKAAAANTEAEVNIWNKEVDTAKLALESLINELSGNSDNVAAETKTPGEVNQKIIPDKGFDGHTINLGKHSDDPKPNTQATADNIVDVCKELKEQLTKTNLELDSLQKQYEALNTRHKELKVSIQQNNITAAAEKAEKKELQDKYDKALDNSKTLTTKVEFLEKELIAKARTLKEECDASLKLAKEATEQKAEKKRQEFETRKGTSEQIRCDIIKLALTHLGHTAPENFKSDAFYNTILNLYDFVKKDLLTRHSWKFALEECFLIKAAKQRINYGKSNHFSYELPKDLLKIQTLIPNCDYEIMGNNLLCRTDNAALVYIKYVDDASLPELFKTLLVYSLAASSAPLVTQNEVIARKWEVEANQRFCMAIANDTSQQTTYGVIRNPIYLAHFS